VQMHSYDNGPSTKTKANNWGQVKKMMAKRGLNVSHQLLDDVAAVRPPSEPSSEPRCRPLRFLSFVVRGYMDAGDTWGGTGLAGRALPDTYWQEVRHPSVVWEGRWGLGLRQRTDICLGGRAAVCCVVTLRLCAT